MLGGEQDCYGGCVDRGQGFRGEMDEVRIWRVARTHAEILEHMRDGGGGATTRAPLEGHPDLAAYWRFNDPGNAVPTKGTPIALDSSGRGNHLRLISLPSASRAAVSPALPAAGALSFRNNYAMNQGIHIMPTGDFTVEFWARTPALNASSSGANVYYEFFNYGAAAGADFLDDAILIEKYSHEFRGSAWVDYRQDVSTAGAISIHVNANRQGMGGANDHWIDYAVGWIDDNWHHIAVSWAQNTGEVALHFDGRPQTPFWRSSAGNVEARSPDAGGVPRTIATGTSRPGTGSLVLGSKQESLGGGFSPQYSLHGEMAVLRVWDRVLTASEVVEGMGRVVSNLTSTSGLILSYEFDPDTEMEVSANGATGVVRNTFPGQGQHLYLGDDAPLWVFSSAPLETASGPPAPLPKPGPSGHALRLNDRQVLVLPSFTDFPATELTLEFWMLSTDACRAGTPFSYAAGGYGTLDNAFLLFDYNDWGVAVMEDEGTSADHSSGVGSTDGRWTHVAVAWRSVDGDTRLYLNGRPAWQVTRATGKSIPSGGTLVIGRDQDCPGGCFDSDWGAAGPVSDDYKQEYGSQDFFGLIDEMRLWRTARDQDQIVSGMHAKLGTQWGGGGCTAKINPSDPDLVAYWTFDEGEGFAVHDVTGRGHDLRATQPAMWEVVAPVAICGNGVLEAGEECDTGSPGQIPGCTKDCKVAWGWSCTKTSPSKCWRGGAGEGGAAGEAGFVGRTARYVLCILLITGAAVAVVAGIVAAVGTYRETLYDRFPALEGAAGAVQVGLTTAGNAVIYRLGDIFDRASVAASGMRGGGGGGGGGYSFAGDLEEPLESGGSPAFTRTVPPPERVGYSPLAGN